MEFLAFGHLGVEFLDEACHLVVVGLLEVSLEVSNLLGDSVIPPSNILFVAFLSVALGSPRLLESLLGAHVLLDFAESEVFGRFSELDWGILFKSLLVQFQFLVLA